MKFNSGETVYCAICNVYTQAVTKRTVNYQGDDGRVWVKTYGDNDKHYWFYSHETFYDYQSALAYAQAYKAELDRVNALSDEDWVIEDSTKYLRQFFEPVDVDKYMKLIKALPNLGSVEVKVRDGIVYYSYWKPADPCRPLVPSTRHRESKAEREIRFKQEAIDREERFKAKWIVLRGAE